MRDPAYAPPWRRALHRRMGLAGGLVTVAGLVLPRPTGAQAGLVTCSGAGVNVKEMPDPDGGAPVPLRESFAFDAHYAQCLIEDNPAAFAMDTFSMGRVVIQPHAFFMAMYATEIGIDSIRRAAGDTRAAKLVGQLGCATYAGTAALTVGSRTDQEPAFFEIEAVDGGHGGGGAGDSFAFTVFFDPAQAPLNYAIFGPRPTFTGQMVAGEITIDAPTLRPLLE